eukprot:3451948-Prymnesium_polylepis.1
MRGALRSAGVWARETREGTQPRHLRDTPPTREPMADARAPGGEGGGAVEACLTERTTARAVGEGRRRAAQN